MKQVSEHPTLDAADFAVLRKTPLFAGLADEVVRDLTEAARVQRFADSSLIFSAGDSAEAVFVVVKGAVKLFVLSPEGSETVIDIVESGLSFAEAAMFASASYPVNCEAMEETRLIRIGRTEFLNQLQRRPATALQILASLGQWQLHLMSELRQLKARTPAQRLAWFLVKLSDSSADGATVRFPYPKSVIASRIGITPESLSRALSRLASLGVETHADIVTIADVDRLREYCGE